MVPREVEGLRGVALALALLAAPAVRGDDAPAPPDCDRLWQATRSLCKAGERAAGEEKTRLLGQAIAAGEEAVRRCPGRVEAHYWLGASYGRYAEAKGGLTALRLVGRIRGEMEASIRLQRDYEGGDAFLALGELDLQVPRLLGGNRTRGVARLEEGLRVAPGNLEIRLALAEAYLRAGRRPEALVLLRSIRDAPVADASSDETRRRARELLQELEPRAGPPSGAPGPTDAPPRPEAR